MRAVVGDECEMNETRSRDEPADQNPQAVDVSTLVINISRVCIFAMAPGPSWAAVVAGESPSNKKQSNFRVFGFDL